MKTVVGYQTQDWMANTFYMMGGQFEKTDGEALKLSEIDFGFDPTLAPTIDRDGEYKKTALQVQIAFTDHEGNEPYYFAKNPKTGAVVWVNAANQPSDPMVAAGIGFWFRDPQSDKPAFTSAGQVVPDSPWEKTFTSTTYYMLVNPFPISYKIDDMNAIVISGLDDDVPTIDRDGEYQKSATQIQVPFADHEGFEPYYYAKNPKTSANVWVNAANQPVTDIVVPAGRGCWFRPAKENTKVTFYMK